MNELGRSHPFPLLFPVKPQTRAPSHLDRTKPGVRTVARPRFCSRNVDDERVLACSVCISGIRRWWGWHRGEVTVSYCFGTDYQWYSAACFLCTTPQFFSLVRALYRMVFLVVGRVDIGCVVALLSVWGNVVERLLGYFLCRENAA